jgi:hypothetical protein
VLPDPVGQLDGEPGAQGLLDVATGLASPLVVDTDDQSLLLVELGDDLLDLAG